MTDLYLYLIISGLVIISVLLSVYLFRIYRRDKKKVNLIQGIIVDNKEEKVERIKKVL